MPVYQQFFNGFLQVFDGYLQVFDKKKKVFKDFKVLKVFKDLGQQITKKALKK